MTKELTDAQKCLLSLLASGWSINQGTLALTKTVKGKVHRKRYDRRSLRALINARKVWVNPETMRWEARSLKDA